MRFLLWIALSGALASSAIAESQPHPFASFDLASEAILNDPHDLTIGPDGRLYVADKFGFRIVVLNAETLELEDVIAEGELPMVRDISFGPNGHAAVAVMGASAVFVFNNINASILQPAQFLVAPRTEGALFHSNGQIYAMAGGIGGLIAYRDGEIAATASGHPGAHDVAEDPDGNIWVADNFNQRLVKYAPDLTRLQVLDHPKFGFIGPRYMDIDEFGRIIVADQESHRILMIDPEGPDGGTLVGVLGSGSPGKGPNLFDDPEGVAVDGSVYYFADSDNNRVVRYVLVIN